jgi:hypothetical protein
MTTSNRQITLPARVEGLIARDLGDEIVVLDPKTQQAHRLTARDAEVWRQAGTATSDELLLQQASRLQALGLLDAKGISRRQLIARAGMVAAAAPLVTLALPMAQAAASVPTITVTGVTCGPTVGGVHSITSLTFSFTTTNPTSNSTMTVTFTATNGSTLAGTGSQTGSSGKGSGTASTGGLTSATAGTQTVTWQAVDGNGAVTSGTAQVTFC